jgi:AcrB/AcrD/AcrF family
MVESVSNALGLSSYSNDAIKEDDLKGVDRENLEWCRSVTAEYEALDAGALANLDQLMRAAPLIFGQLERDAKEERQRRHPSALGVVVDDAIVYIENIARRLRQHREAHSDKPKATIVLEASGELRRALLFATLIILLAVLPIFFMYGLSGSFFRPLAFSYALAVGTSLAVAVIVTPALGLTLLGSAPLQRGEPADPRLSCRG